MSSHVALQVASNFSFLRGASHPEELVETAAALGQPALAITDRNSLAGVVRAHKAAKQAGIRLVVGCRLDLQDAPSLLCYPTDRAAYGRLCELLTLGKRRAEKAQCHLTRVDILAHAEGQVFLALASHDPDEAFERHLAWLAERVPGACYLAAQMLYRDDDTARLARLACLAARHGLPLVATNDVHYHHPERRPLHDVLTCVRRATTIDHAGYYLFANSERHLKTAEEMRRLFKGHEDAVARSLEIADRCRFSLDELRYEYPEESVEGYATPREALGALTWEGAAWRYPDGIPERVRGVLEHELELIQSLDYAPYFLTVHDIVCFARSRGILCQGRGSAANSAVCYCLGITAVDPARVDLLFERFVSAARNEPPDIDVDFEHERREEVIQYIYEKYGRHRAGMTATVICYRTRGAVRDIGKALGLSEDAHGALAKALGSWGRADMEGAEVAERIREAGLDPADRRVRLTIQFARILIGFPRHLSQHVGGFVITRGDLSSVVPIENAAMADRTVIEWDKDDLDVLGILKIDVLALGMLTCLRKGLSLLDRHYGRRLSLASVPAEDPATYDMLCRADTIGVFQVESRAQMSMLPRLKPRDFYDLVIEVAIVRPGPIQGDMVHPYLRRRNGEERVEFPSDALRGVLQKTLGVPLFQEQAMQVAMVAAGFTADEADGLRRAMATFKRGGDIHRYGERLIPGMIARGYDPDFATRCFRQIEGFGTYGFPESHAASFALLVYVSAWMKCHYPEVFACALLNSQPMGFYAPAQIVRDARDHGVTVLSPDVNLSVWDCALEEGCDDRPSPKTSSPSPLEGEGRGEGGKRANARFESLREASNPFGVSTPRPRRAVRLGLRQIKGIAEEDARALEAARPADGYADPWQLWRRAGLPRGAMERLADADAFASMGLGRREALWAVRALGPEPLPLFAASETAQGMDIPETPPDRESAAALPELGEGEEIIADYTALRLSLRRHPCAVLRAPLTQARVTLAGELVNKRDGQRVTVAGLVLVRQRPGSAKGVIFMTLEDESGVANIVLWNHMFQRFRRQCLQANLLLVEGKQQREGMVIHVVAERLVNRNDLLAGLSIPPDETTPSVTLRPAPYSRQHPRDIVPLASEGLAHADEVRRPGPDPIIPEGRYAQPQYWRRRGTTEPGKRDDTRFPSRNFR